MYYLSLCRVELRVTRVLTNDKILRKEGESLPYGPKAGGLKP